MKPDKENIRQEIQRTAKRFVIEVPDEYHRLVKISAAEKNISIRAWMSRAIKAELEKDKQYE